jgi:hypothetical protein
MAALTRTVAISKTSKPRSVAEVDPAKLAATFGDGWRFGAMNVEVVSFQPITMGRIDPLLPWLKEHLGLGPLWQRDPGEQVTDRIEEQIKTVNLRWARD